MAVKGATPEPAIPASSTSSETPDWPSEVAANWRGPEDDEDGDRTHATPDTPTLRDHLRAQLSLTNLGVRDRALVELLIDALDEDGYLTQPLEEIAAAAARPRAAVERRGAEDRALPPAALRARRRRRALAGGMPGLCS